MNSSPAVGADGTIYVGSDDDNLYALNPNGTLKWKFSTGNWGVSPAVGTDGTLYFGSLDYNLYAVGPPPCPPGEGWTESANGFQCHAIPKCPATCKPAASLFRPEFPRTTSLETPSRSSPARRPRRHRDDYSAMSCWRTFVIGLLEANE